MTPTLALIRSLVTPDASFRRGELYHVPRSVALSALLFLAVLAGTLSAAFHANPTAQELQLRRELQRVERLMLNAPTEQREIAMEQVRRQITRGAGVIGVVQGALGAVVRWLILYFEIWLLVLLLVQFAGGEERPLGPRRHGRSKHLIVSVLAPLILAELVQALLLQSTSPAAYSSAPTYEEYLEAVRVTLSLPEAAGLSLAGLAPTLQFLSRQGSNPFVWWAGYVFVAGSTEVFRLSPRRSSVVAAVVLLLIALQHGALQAVGNLF